MLEPRKETEKAYYDNHAQVWLKQDNQAAAKGDFEGFDPSALASYRFVYRLLTEHGANKIVLDYGCGNGLHSVFLAKAGAAKVIAIDISEKSLAIARKLAQKEGVAEKIEFRVMDCEKTDFSENTFDLIFDGGTFSSLDLDKAFPELARILKSDGHLIGIETLGHNPLTNFKRQLNRLAGRRTDWAVSHIFKMADFDKAGHYFRNIEKHYFHLFSWLFFPFLALPGGRSVLRLWERGEALFLRLDFLKKYAFKVVFIFSQPIKND